MNFLKGIAGAAAMLIGLSAPQAQAGYIVDLTQEGSNVVATGSGAIDLTGLTFLVSVGGPAYVWPSIGLIETGLVQSVDVYTGFTGPTSFGSGGTLVDAGNGTGDNVGINGSWDNLAVPVGYVSDSALSETATWDNQTSASLGVTPGRYEWTWGSGPNQNFTLVVEAAAVPEPSTWTLMLLGLAGLGFMGFRSPLKLNG